MPLSNVAPANTNPMPPVPEGQPAAQPATQPVPSPVPPTAPVIPVAMPVPPVAPVPPATPVPQAQAVPPAAQVPQDQPILAVPPVAPPVPQTVPEHTPQPVQFTPTGDQALDAAASIVASKGFDPAVLAQEMSDYGQLTVTTRAALEAKLGVEQVALLSSTYTTAATKAKNVAEERNNAVYTEVGGKEQWDAIAEWTTTDAAGLSPEAADSYNNMLALGGVQAILAAKALKEAYMASPGFKEANPVMQTPTSTVPNAPVNAAISRRQYTEERKKAVREGNAAAVTELDNRARFTMEKLPNQWRFSSVIN